MNTQTPAGSDALRDICRMAAGSRTQTARLRWITHRAACALEGREFDPREVESPSSIEHEVSRLRRQNAELKARLAALTPPAESVSDGRVRELVEADLEYDAASAAWDEAPGSIQCIGDTDSRDFDGPEFMRLIAAMDRREKALAAMQATGAEP